MDAFLRAPQVDVRRYAPRFLHGKTYIFSSDPDQDATAPGAALVTSANLTTGGLSGNLELGLARYDPWLVREATDWFDALWAEAEPFTDDLLDLLFPPAHNGGPRDDLPARVAGALRRRVRGGGPAARDNAGRLSSATATSAPATSSMPTAA